MDFSLRCAYAHGTRAMRTHLDSVAPQDEISWPVFETIREKWRGRIELQACLPARHRSGARPGLVRRTGQARWQRPRACSAASPIWCRTWKSCSTSCSRWPSSTVSTSTSMPTKPTIRGACSLTQIAEAALRHGFQGKVLVGHCCSLARQPDRRRARRTRQAWREAGHRRRLAADVQPLPAGPPSRGTHAALARRHAAARDEGARHPGGRRLRQHPRSVLCLWRSRHA